MVCMRLKRKFWEIFGTIQHQAILSICIASLLHTLIVHVKAMFITEVKFVYRRCWYINYDQSSVVLY